ncbi:methyltransferase domain-containing protein [Georgenia satyanarayanai]|uniref:class I SAM-dependent methyltransferase n=1 Tax=Georgenia satyanarayanai TaxID=860221 RepID=UPI00203F6144|nr:methyltransferase domain-containing protein [Georgenia satyanarayanai]MCM3661718.1 methyltransferase domain-containing protein [Georgenia satyanarayanai]
MTPSTITTTGTTADRELKARHRAMWALGDYPAVADEVIPALGAELVAEAGTGPGQTVLDVAAGSGNVAVRAALTGARVVAADLTPALLEAGAARAQRLGATVEWVEADAEDLPFPDASFDVVTSCVGVMFAPHHQRAADELVRVVRPGGTLALTAWTPEGFIGQLFAAVRPFAPTPPPDAQPAPRWGDEGHVRTLLGDRVEVLTAERRILAVDRFTGPEHFRDFFATTYGPTVALYRAHAGDAEAVAGLDAALTGVADRFGRREAGGFTMGWKYLLLVGRRR